MVLRLLHVSPALRAVYGKLLMFVTRGKANEHGRLAMVVTRVTPVTWVLKGVWIDIFTPLFQTVR